MARTLLAQLRLAIRDDLSTGAKKAAGALDGVGAAADRLGRKRPALDGFSSNLDKARLSAAAMGRELQHAQWGTAFTRQLEKIKIAPSEFEKIRASWNRLQTDLATGSRRAHVVLGAQDTWKKDTLGALIALRGETERLHQARSRLVAGAKGFVRQGFLLGGAGGGLYAGYAGVRGTLRAGANEAREGARSYLGGFTAYETVALAAKSRLTSARFPSVDNVTLQELLRESALSLGSIPKALELSESLGQTFTVLQSLKGRDSALSELTRFLRGLDTLGKNIDPAEIRTLLDGTIRAAGVEGAEYSPGDVWSVAKMSKSAGFSLSDQFINTVLPSLIADMGAPRVGTALGSSTAQMIGGRATAKAKAYQAQVGIRDRKGVVQQDLFASNPYTWTQEVLVPALLKSGIDTTNEPKVVEAVNKLFSNQVVGDLFGRMITQAATIEKKRAAVARAPGIDAAAELPQRDPYVALEGSLAQARNAAAALADPILPTLTSGLNGLAGVLSKISGSLRENPLGTYGTAAAGAGVLGVGGFATWKALKAITGAAALEGAAASLVGSAQALTTAAARLGLGTSAGSIAAGTSAVAAGGASATAGAVSLVPVFAALAAGGYFAHKVSTGDWPLRTEESRERGRALERQNNPMGSSASQDAALKAMLAKQEAAGRAAGAGTVAAVAQGLAANSGQVDAASQSIFERIKSFFSGGVNVPVRPTLGGGAVIGGSAPANPAGRANGGNVYPGGLYQINEYGKEFFQPAERGTIYPARKFRSGGVSGRGAGAVTITNHVTVSAARGEDVDALAERVVSKIESKLRQDVRGLFADYGVEIA